MSNENDKPFYGNGTAAGWKGNSLDARQNSAGAAHEVSMTLPRRHRQMISAWTPYAACGAIPEQVADDLDMPVHIVRPRAGELVRKGLLFEVGKRMGRLGKHVMAYSAFKPDGPPNGLADDPEISDGAR